MFNLLSSPNITNSIIYGNNNSISNDGGTPFVTYSLVQGGYAGTGNINANPLFTDAANGDYSLQPGSPAINAGFNDSVPVSITTDLAGNARIKANTVDMGALEFQKDFYYSTGSNAANVLANWNSEPDGTGTTATSFTDTTRFTVQTGHTLTNNSSLDFGNSALFIENNAGIDNTGTLSVGSTFSNDGAVTGTGTVVLNGTMSAQNISGIGTISNLTLNNNAGATITGSSKVSVTNTYTPTAGVLTTNNNLVLKSTATGTASIASGDAAGNYIDGSIEVERFIPAKAARKWIFLGSPITGSISNTWQQNIHITGAGTGGTVCPTFTAHSNGYDATVSNAPNIYTYDAANASGTRWTKPATTIADNVEAGKGFRVNVRGDRSLGCSLLDGSPSGLIPTAVTLRAIGAVSNAQKNAGNFSITYNNAKDIAFDAGSLDQYVFIANPYPSAINFGTFRTANSSKIANNYAIYIPANASGIYTYWDGTAGELLNGDPDPNFNNATGDVIASGQAFFVESSLDNDNTITLDFAENQKSGINNTGYFRTRTFNEKLRITYLNNGNKADEIVIRYANEAGISNTEKGAMDITSINSGTFISSLKGTKGMAVQTRDLQTLSNDEVWLNVAATTSGTYQFNFSEFENFAGADIYLIDHLTNTTQDIKQNPAYSFSIDNNNPETKGAARFSVVFSKKLQPELTLNTVIKMYPNPADKQVTLQLPQSADNSITYNIKITDVTGKILLQQKVSGGTEQLNISRLSQGTYIVEIIDSKGKRTTEKLIKN
ncbi:MAG: T9SS type A sorting domain-containing protein [Chitinophagaceae bacterium]|nr:T9SS type A sorting domain-containing protein [Chitinophagaceae bacterium]MCW5905205.1 T9SS type A sorting domain-containing protein [Chitinophagaceae bacterium]